MGLRRAFSWKFIVAEIQTPIIGSDFLSHFGLLVDMKNRQLIDGVTNLRTQSLQKVQVPQASLKLLKAEQRFSDILAEFPSILNPIMNQPVKSDVTHHIQTTGPPVFARPRRLDPVRLEAAKKEISELLDAKICRPSKSNWASPAHLVKKKDSNKWRLCGDYRALNKITVPDRYPIPYLQDFGNVLHGKKVFSKIDLKKAFHQVPVEPSDIPKTAITLPFGLFEFKYMTFGLCNAAQTFQRLIHEVCRGLDFVFCYLDDVSIASKNEEEHENHLRVLFQRLKEHGLTINVEKCELGQKLITFLGHHISSEGTKQLPEKVKAIQDFEKPKIAKDLKRFLATINFYRRFIPHAVKNQMFLTKLIDGNKKNDNTPVQWTDEASAAFEKCKEDLSNAALLVYPNKTADLSLEIDASDKSVGCVLHQYMSGIPQPLGFYSKKTFQRSAKIQHV